MDDGAARFQQTFGRLIQVKSASSTNSIQTTPNVLRVAVLSDLHAYDGSVAEFKKRPPSHWDINRPDNSPLLNPIVGLRHLISPDPGSAQQPLTADITLCPGDMTNKAHTGALDQAWATLQQFGRALQSRLVLAAPGNHDHDSRSIYCKYDPRNSLQSLIPPFPTSDDAQNDRFWSRHWICVKEQAWRVILLNTSAYEGIHDEFKHGRVSDRTLADISGELRDRRDLNLLVCHHHPQAHDVVGGLGDYSSMQGGTSLLETLESAEGRTAVIHGHRHHPRLFYAQGGAGSPLVFSAGSLCARLDGVLGTTARNQFYIIEFHLDLFETYGCVGRFQAWDWHYGQGWHPAATSDEVPDVGGFGFRNDPAITATELARDLSEPINTWLEILQLHPELQYMLPVDIKRLSSELQRKHQFHVVMENEWRIAQINRRSI
jgi:hypothetical protein